MATRTQKMKVGVFLLICLGIVLGGLALVTGLHENQGENYSIEFRESVLGLYDGAEVVYLGVPVGKVADIFVTDDYSAHVEVLIQPEKVTLRKGVEAQLAIYSLAAGTMAVSLAGGEPSAPELPHGAQIPAKTSTITAVSSRIEELVDGLAQAIGSINRGLEDLEEGKLTDIVDRAHEVLDEGRAFLEKGQGLVENADVTLTDFRGDADKVIDRLMALSDDVHEVAENVNKLVISVNGKVDELDVPQTQQEMGRVLENLGDLTEKLNNTMGEFDAMSANVLHEAGNVEFSLRRSLQEIGEALETTRMFVDQLREDPSSIIRGKGQAKETQE